MFRHLFVFAVLFTTTALPACGYYLLGEEYRIAVFNPYLIGDDYATFFYSSERFEHWQTEKSGRDRLRNVDLWAQELGGRVTGADVEAILYGTTLEDWLNAKNGNAAKPFAGNPAWAAIKKRPEVLEYALYAKGYETESAAVDRWGDPVDDEATKSPYRQDFKQRAQAGYDRAKKGSFLKQRYAYQLLLLARYERDYAAMQPLFDQHFKGKTGPLADWARFHYAGRDTGSKRYFVDMANAFRYAPEKAFVAFQNTRAEGEPFKPEDYLSAARTAAERSNLYALAAVHHPGYALDLLKKAYELDRTNPVVELLVVREMNKLEDWLMTYELTYLGPSLESNDLPYEYDTWDKYEDYEAARRMIIAKNYDRDRKHLSRFNRFLIDYMPGRPELGSLLRAQAALLAEDYAAALRHLYGLPTDGAVGTQATMIRYLATVQQPGLPAARRDALVAEQLPRLEATYDEYDNLRYVPARVASQVYAAAGDTVTAYFLYNRSLPLPAGGMWASEYYTRLDYLDRRISDGVLRRVIKVVADKQGENPVQQLLLADNKVPTDALRDLAGTLALRRNDLGTALDHFEAIAPDFYANNHEWYLEWSPFSDLVGKKISLTSKADVVRQMIGMEQMTGQGDDAAAAACLTLARAWYNMSWAGCSWNMLNYGQSGYPPQQAEPWPHSYGHRATPHHEADYDLLYRASRAADYLDCAEASVQDEELAAHVAFLRTQLDNDRLRMDILALGYTEDAKEKRLLEEMDDNLRGFVRAYGGTEYGAELRRVCEGVGRMR